MITAADVLDGTFLGDSADDFLAIVSAHYVQDEAACLEQLMRLAEPESIAAVADRARHLIESVRRRDDAVDNLDALLQQYSLDTREGVMLMCLAEALLRVPDAATADALIRDKLNAAQWDRHLGQSEHALVNAAAWGLALTGRVMTMEPPSADTPGAFLRHLIRRSGEPVIRAALLQAMKIMGRQFVLGRNIDEALRNARHQRDKGYSYSFDMLGEAALTRADAARYLADYQQAIAAVAADSYMGTAPRPTIAIKLSALHPRYEAGREQQVREELGASLLILLRQARAGGVGVTRDAEEADRLELSLQVFAQAYRHPELAGW